MAMLNGIRRKEKEDVPQIDRKSIIRVRQVLHCSNAHHGDAPLE